MAKDAAVGHRSEPLDQLALLYSMADHIQRARHVDLIYDEAVEGLRNTLGVDRCALLILDDGLMRLKAWAGLTETARSGIEGFAPWAASARDPQPVVVEDVQAAPAVEVIRDALIQEGVSTLACVPLLHRGRLIGEIVLFRDQQRPFDPASIRLASAIAGHLAFAIWRSRSDADQEELLRRFEAERSVLESVVKQMPAGVLLADVPSGRIVLTNPQASTVIGRPLRHASQVSDYALWGGLDASGEPLPPQEWPLARSVLHGEVVRDEELQLRREDGRVLRVRMSSAPVRDSQGRQLAAVATIHDVTREREEEDRQSFLEEATRVLNASLELGDTLAGLARLVVERCGDWCVIYRYAPPDRIERVAAAHRDPEAAELVRRFTAGALSVDEPHAVAEAIRERRPVVETNTLARMEREPGHDPDVRDAVRRLGGGPGVVLPLAARGRPLGALAVARAEGRFSEEEVAHLSELARRAGIAVDNASLYEQARAADRAKSNFLAVMSHEFRTPLSAIVGYTDILAAEVHGELNPKQMTHLERMKASVRHLSHLVDEILSFASMEAGRERIRPEPVELVSIVRDCVAIMEPIAEAAGLELRVELPTTAVEMTADGSKLRQILINLLSNAIKYTADGHVALTLEADDARVRCQVADTGPGIAPDHLESVFEPFWQVERYDGRRISGTGLGLAVARRLARLMGGDVRLRSELGDGSTFSLELPRKPPQDMAAPRPS